MPSGNNMPKSAKSKIKVKCGLTLIELLIVSMIMVVVALAINYSLGSGVKVWKKINRELIEEDANIFFDKFTTDLHNSLDYAGIKFIGQEDKLSLATLVTSSRFSGRSPGEIVYVYNAQADTLDRKLKDYSAVYNNEEGLGLPVLKNLHSLEFSYYFFDAQSKDYRWQGEWKKEGLPFAVRLEFEIKDGEKFKKFTRTVTIPISG
jgi:prepilin-type N-terminal cleavage/methylation domain-containing protein